MNFRGLAERERLPTLDFTAMVDLVFLLIIFFLTTSTFIEKNRAQLQLPKDSTVDKDQLQTVDRSAIVINVTANGRIIVAQEELSIERLGERVAAELAKAKDSDDDLDLLVRADRRASLVHVNAVAERLIDLGVDRWKLAMEVVPGDEGSEP